MSEAYSRCDQFLVEWNSLNQRASAYTFCYRSPRWFSVTFTYNSLTHTPNGSHWIVAATTTALMFAHATISSRIHAPHGRLQCNELLISREYAHTQCHPADQHITDARNPQCWFYVLVFSVCRAHWLRYGRTASRSKLQDYHYYCVYFVGADEKTKWEKKKKAHTSSLAHVVNRFRNAVNGDINFTFFLVNAIFILN